MLIIEGTDLVGKTTVAHKLAKRLNMLYQHLGPLPEGWTERDYLDIAAPDLVRDRFHMSEICYHAVNNKPCIIDDYTMLNAWLRVRCCAYTVVIVVAHKCEHYFDERWREGEKFTLDQIKHVNRKYIDNFKHADDVFVMDERRPFLDDQDIDDIVENYTRRRKWWESNLDIIRSSM
jgi:thymidylate kinase